MLLTVKKAPFEKFGHYLKVVNKAAQKLLLNWTICLWLFDMQQIFGTHLYFYFNSSSCELFLSIPWRRRLTCSLWRDVHKSKLNSWKTIFTVWSAQFYQMKWHFEDLLEFDNLAKQFYYSWTKFEMPDFHCILIWIIQIENVFTKFNSEHSLYKNKWNMFNRPYVFF